MQFAINKRKVTRIREKILTSHYTLMGSELSVVNRETEFGIVMDYVVKMLTQCAAMEKNG